jgi:hypothetical protein
MTFKGKHYKPKNSTPGPDRYNITEDAYYSRIVSGKIGREQRKEPFLKKEEFNKPGPGYHDPIKCDKVTLSYSIVGKPTDGSSRNWTGPGHYDILSHKSTGSVKHISRYGSIGAAKRNTSDNFIIKDSGPHATMRSH